MGVPATAVVVTHNSAGHAAGCLRALREAGLRVRVVDNASTDGTVALIRHWFPDVELFAGRDNVGFSAGVNRGLAGVESDVVLLVNPDCVVPPQTVRELVRVLRADLRVGIAGPRLRQPGGRVAVSAHPFESLSSVLASRFGGGLAPVALRRLLAGRHRREAYDACRGSGSPGAPTDPVTVDWVSGACLAVRTSLLRRIGGLDERYFLYYEDEELCLQAWRHGTSVVYLPHVEAVHVGGASSADPTRTWPHLYRSMLLFFGRNRRPSFQAVRAAVVLRALIGIGLGAVRLAVQPRRGSARIRAWGAVTRIAVMATAEPKPLEA